MMTDGEVICAWMEPKPDTYNAATAMAAAKSGKDNPIWWVTDGRTWTLRPRELDLDALWEVQDRLTDEQWERYECEMLAQWTPEAIGLTMHGEVRHYLHATAEQKIRALAAILRPLVGQSRGNDGRQSGK